MVFQNCSLLIRSPYPETFVKCKGALKKKKKTLQTGSFPKRETGRLSITTTSRGGPVQVVPPRVPAQWLGGYHEGGTIFNQTYGFVSTGPGGLIYPGEPVRSYSPPWITTGHPWWG